MGISASAVIIVGYTYDELYPLYEKYLADNTGNEDVMDWVDWVEDNDFNQVSPYYDSQKEDMLYGHILDNTPDHCPCKIKINCNSETICKQYSIETGIEANLYLSPDIW